MLDHFKILCLACWGYAGRGWSHNPGGQEDSGQHDRGVEDLDWEVGCKDWDMIYHGSGPIAEGDHKL